jgi:DNA-binding NarL/FixJ family response regulator
MIRFLKKLLGEYDHHKLALDELADMKRQVALLTGRLSSLESEPRETPVAVTLRSSMNLDRRTQALRLFRSGRTTPEIAKALDMPRAQIDLLVKVHQIVQTSRLD